MLDRDLSELYGVETRILNQAVKRNIKRFPEDFMFQLTKEEFSAQRSQIVIFEKGKGKYPKYLPYMFTLLWNNQGKLYLSVLVIFLIRYHSYEHIWPLLSPLPPCAAATGGWRSPRSRTARHRGS